MTTTLTGADVAAVVDLWLANNEDAYREARRVCLDAVVRRSGTGPIADLYADAVRTGDLYAWQDTAGLCLAEWLRQDVAEARANGGLTRWAADMLLDLLDLGNRHLWAGIAAGFLPEPEEVASCC